MLATYEWTRIPPIIILKPIQERIIHCCAVESHQYRCFGCNLPFQSIEIGRERPERQFWQSLRPFEMPCL